MADGVGWLLLAAGLPPVALTLAVVSVRQIRAGRGEATAG